MSTAIETAKNETETAKQTVSVSIPADVARQFKAKHYRVIFSQLGENCRLSCLDYAIQWTADDSRDVSATMPPGWLELSKAGLPVDIVADDSTTRDRRDYSAVKVETDCDRDALQWVALAADDQSSRFALAGVAVTELGTLVATDGRRLHVATTAYPYPVGQSNDIAVGIIPSESVAVACRLARKSSILTISIFDWSAQIELVTKNGTRLTVWSRLIEGRFPRWSDCIPGTQGETGELERIDSKELKAETARCKANHQAATAKLSAKDAKKVDVARPERTVGAACFDLRYLADIPADSRFGCDTKRTGAYRFDFESFGHQCTAVVMPLVRDKR